MRPILRGITASTVHESVRRGPLRGSVLLEELRTPSLERLVDGARWVRFARGDNLTLRGSRASSCWLLLTGYVKEHRALDDGSDALSGFRGPGDLVAEVAAITRRSCDHDVTALGPGEALALDVDGLHRLAHEDPAIRHALLLAVADRATAAETTLARNDVCDASQRIMLALVELAERWGMPTSRGVAICLPLTQSELAEWVGTSRETAAKVLHRLRQRDLVETSRRRLVVGDLDRLRLAALTEVGRHTLASIA